MSKKITKAYLNRKYDELYAEGQRLLDKYKPCAVVPGTLCHHGQFCCAGCNYLSSKGCTVKSLWCKLWLCRTAREHRPKVAKRFFKMKAEASKMGFTFFGRASKKMNLARAYHRHSL